MAQRFQLATAGDTARLAAAFAPHLAAGDCLLLHGPVGAGKTHFVRSLIQHLNGPAEEVPSPTFTLVQTYETPQGALWHTDLYRLCHVDEVVELGLEDAFGNAITFVEWPDRLGALAPARRLDLVFSFPDPDSDLRQLDVTAKGNGWEWLASLS